MVRILLAAVITYCSVAAANAQTLTSSAEGTVVAARSWNVSAEVQNKISRIHFIEGQDVSAGDLLVEFDLAFKEAELALAEANLAKAAVALEIAQDNFETQKALFEKETISDAAFDDAAFALRLAEADFRIVEVQRDMTKGILEVQKLYAPFDGQISAPRYPENTNIIPIPGAEIATIVQLDPIHVRAPQVIERVMNRLLSGETNTTALSRVTVKLQLPNGQMYPHEGKIVTWSVGLDESSQQAVAIAEFPNPDLILRPGMKVIVAGYE